MTAPHDAPSAAELVEAVREFLERDVLGATEGRVHSPPGVATAVGAGGGVESGRGAGGRARHADRLAALGMGDDAELAAAIRSGALDDRYDEVKAAVWASVRDKLAVANPRYLGT